MNKNKSSSKQIQILFRFCCCLVNHITAPLSLWSLVTCGCPSQPTPWKKPSMLQTLKNNVGRITAGEYMQVTAVYV